MRRITIWLTATLAVVAMAFYYQAGLSGDGKAGDHGAGGRPAIAQPAPTAKTRSASNSASTTPTTTQPTQTTTTTHSDTRDGSGSDSDHTGSPAKANDPTGAELSPRPDVLIVDDDEGVRGALRRGLEAEGFAPREAADGSVALEEIAARPPAIVVLDVSMPGLTGIDVVRTVRADGLTLPICMLSARDEVEDRVAGLAAGADDYVVKPFSIGELAARLHALVRLDEQRPGRPLTLGELTIDPSRRVALRAGRNLELTTREFDLLFTLARHTGQVLSRQQLLEQVWGYTWEVDSNSVDVFVGYIRKKLEAGGEPRLLHTVRGVGFALRP